MSVLARSDDVVIVEKHSDEVTTSLNFLDLLTNRRRTSFPIFSTFLSLPGLLFIRLDLENKYNLPTDNITDNQYCENQRRVFDEVKHIFVDEFLHDLLPFSVYLVDSTVAGSKHLDCVAYPIIARYNPYLSSSPFDDYRLDKFFQNDFYSLSTTYCIDKDNYMELLNSSRIKEKLLSIDINIEYVSHYNDKSLIQIGLSDVNKKPIGSVYIHNELITILKGVTFKLYEQLIMSTYKEKIL